jgi:hypothetical protein
VAALVSLALVARSVTARPAAQAIGTGQTLVEYWNAHHLALPPAPLVTHADVENHVVRTVKSAPRLFSSEVIGRSIEGRAIHHLWFGNGAAHVLLWSQMHGDEPTATSAVFDLMEWVRESQDSTEGRRLLERLTVHIVPMLNPDGAQAYRRRNAQGIDINRDALRLQTPEGRALKALRDRIEPVLGFNLHNQNWQTSVGAAPKPASISLLAVAYDEARSDNPRRILAKKTASIIRDAIDPLIPGQIGRYSDEFEVRAFGDNVARWGTGVVLIETGPIQGPDPDAALVRVNFVALVTALDAIASGRVESADPALYESLPTNGSRLFHTLVQNATVVAGTGVDPFLADIGIAGARSVRERNGTREIVWSGRIEDLGDLRVYGALETIDATGLTAVPIGDPAPGVGTEVSRTMWNGWKGATIAVGAPARLALLKPIDGNPDRLQVVRIVTLDDTRSR